MATAERAGDAEGAAPRPAGRPRLAPAELRALSRVSDLRGALDVAAVWGVVALAAAGASALGTWWAIALAVLLVGSRQNALATLAHEAWHRLSFRSARVNHAVGAWLCAYPIGIPYHHDRQRHLRHHREVGLPRDPDWKNYTSQGRETPLRVLRYLAGLLCGLLAIETAWHLAVDRTPRVSAEAEGAEGDASAPSVLGEFVRVACVQAVLFALSAALLSWWVYPLLWALPLATVGGFLANFRALLEHATPRDDVPPEQRLRDFAVGPVEAFLVSPSHFHFHALHHAFVSIPHRRLPEAKRALVRAHGHYPIEVWPGYLRSLARHLRALRQEA